MEKSNIHPLVAQLRFTRDEFVRCLKDVSHEDAVRRVMPMNCISWIIGHLANQEQAYWVFLTQGRLVIPNLNDLVSSGRLASTPPLDEIWTAWHTITETADMYLDTLTTTTLQIYLVYQGKPHPENIGTMILPNIYHYWFHTGEAHAIRDMLGHRALHEFVGDMSLAKYYLEI